MRQIIRQSIRSFHKLIISGEQLSYQVPIPEKIVNMGGLSKAAGIFDNAVYGGSHIYVIKLLLERLPD